MSPSAPASLAGMPDEILQTILNYAMDRPTPLYLEYCTTDQTHFRARAAQAQDEKTRGITTKDTPANRAPGTLRSNLNPSQTPHLADWLCINATCRRFRQIGKEAFFANKTFVMTPTLPVQLKERKFAPLSPADQALALERIRSAVFIEPTVYSPAMFLSIPVRAKWFQRLRQLTLMLGCRVGEGVHLVNTGFESGRREIPEEFLQALVGIGLQTEGVELDVAVCPSTHWEEHARSLTSYIYPTLKFKAMLLEKARSMAEQLEQL